MFRKIYCVGIILCTGFLSVEAQENFETLNILAGGKVIASGYDNSPQYIYEGDFDDAAFDSRNGKIQDPAFVGVLRNRRMNIERFFLFGGVVSDLGGWFDSSESKPVVQIMVNPGDDWTTVAEIEDYPTLDGTDVTAAESGYQNIQFQDIIFDQPLSCVGFRVWVKGATGIDPSQSYISVGELRAYGSLGEIVATYNPPQLDGALPIGSNFYHPREHGGSLVGDVIIDGNTETFVHCQELEAFDFNIFFGFYTANPITLNSVSFEHGPLSESGGWFNTENSKPRVEIRRAPLADWEEVGVIEDYPETNLDTFREDLPADIDQKEWTFTFSEPTEVIGVRFNGDGSYNIDETPFLQCGEITFEGSGNPAYTGPLGTGRDNNGEPFKPDADGHIFIQAEYARSINNAYRIYGHGNTKSGIVIRGNWGPGWEFFSQQIIEFDIEITEGGDYSVFAQQDTLSGWADSYYVTFDDQDPLTPEILDSSNDIRWQPSQGDPAGAPETFDRQLITTDVTLDFWFLEPGVHTFRMGLREAIGILDWILITQDYQLDINAFEEPDVEPPASVQDYSIF